ncbi:uncharacterized protein [Amphiura filiformis]|uniref:uncharacterized protein n=1 Tax=Amphiura filiformis TaxID=82378 RepID=UPI003B221A3C
MCFSRLLLFTAIFVAISGQKDSSTECYNYQISLSGFLSQFYTCCQTPTTTEAVSTCKEPDPIANYQCKDNETNTRKIKPRNLIVQDKLDRKTRGKDVPLVGGGFRRIKLNQIAGCGQNALQGHVKRKKNK